MKAVVEQLRRYVQGWQAYFRLAQAVRVWRKLDEWLRHRLRVIQLEHWRRGTTIYRQLRALGAR
jgi:RNA-directed DNA polymerase